MAMHLSRSLRAVPAALLLATGALGVRAQIYVEAQTADSLTFAFRSYTVGDASGNDTTNWENGLKNQMDSLAGLRVTMTFDAALRQLDLDITNLSGTGQQLFGGTDWLQMGAGTLTGFGFDVNPHGLVMQSFQMLASSGDSKVNFQPAYDLSPYGGSGGQFTFDVGAAASGSKPGLNAGASASFRIIFENGLCTSTTADDFDAAVFNPTGFFGQAGAEFYARFQQTGAKGNDSDKAVLDLSLFVDQPEIPEPSTYGALAVGGLVLLALARRRFRRR